MKGQTPMLITSEDEQAGAAPSLSTLSDEETPCSDQERKLPAVWLTPRLVAMSLGMLLALIAICGTVVAVVGYMRTPRERKDEVTVYDGAGFDDIRELLKTVKQVYPDGEPFKHLKFLDVDDTDPNDIKFELKKNRYPNATLARARVLADKPSMHDLNLATCGINGIQSALTVGQLVINIKSAAEACANPYPTGGTQQDFCAQMVSLDIALWGFLACYIEDMVSACPDKFNADAVCALDVTGLATNGAMVAEGAAGAKLNCVPPGGYQTTPMPAGMYGLSKAEVGDMYSAFGQMEAGSKNEQATWGAAGMGNRRLNTSAPMSRRLQDPTSEAKSWKQAACGLDTTKAAARIAQMGVLIAKADQDCSDENFIRNGNSGKNICGVDVTGAIASAGIAASLITVSVVNCPAALEFTKEMGEQFCAASIIDLVTAVTYMATSIIDIQATCSLLVPIPEDPALKDDIPDLQAKLQALRSKVKSFRIG